MSLIAANRYRGSGERLDAKKALTWNLYRKGWSRDKIVSLCTFLDWIIALPKALESTYSQYVLNIEENLKVEYVTTVERLGIQKGESMVLLRQLEQKFSVLPDEYRKKIQEADSAMLLEWAVRLLDSQSLEELFKTNQ